MGAAYVVTGSVNQGCVESGTSDYVKQILAETAMADVTMAPCADMFEMGAKVDPAKIPQAEKNPKMKMALVFRWYLGSSSRWAVAGDPNRKFDMQIWCGQAMGAFNLWVKGDIL